MTIERAIAEEVVKLMLERGIFGGGNAAPQKRLYSVVEAAEYLGCGTEQIRNMMCLGTLPKIAWGEDSRKFWVDKADMDKLIESRKHAS